MQYVAIDVSVRFSLELCSLDSSSCSAFGPWTLSGFLPPDRSRVNSHQKENTCTQSKQPYFRSNITNRWWVACANSNDKYSTATSAAPSGPWTLSLSISFDKQVLRIDWRKPDNDHMKQVYYELGYIQFQHTTTLRNRNAQKCYNCSCGRAIPRKCDRFRFNTRTKF